MRWTWLALVLLWPGVAWAGDPHLGSPRSASQADIKERYQLALRDRPCAVMIGDSITALLFDADALPGWEVANLGRLGTTTFDWLNDGSACEPDVLRSARCGARQELDGVSCTPAVLHVMLGTNDAGGADNGISWPPAWQEAFYRQLIGDLQGRWPGVPILLSHPPHALLQGKNQRTRDNELRNLDGYRETLRRLIDEIRGVRLGVDFRPRIPLSELPDGIHPDEDGQARMRFLLELRFHRARFWRRR